MLSLALAGMLAGFFLGEMIAEPLAVTRGSDPASYAQYSANPDARVPQGETAAPCFACPDSYGVAARLRAERESKMDSAFRELGTVDLDAPLPDEPASEFSDDGYRYGGRFPDPEFKALAPESGDMIGPAIAVDAPPIERPGTPTAQY